jgi:enterochelin esterase-like enzyme
MPVTRHRLPSRVLKGNPLGDPTERDLYLYVPPGHTPDRPAPAVLLLSGFTGTGAMHFNVDPLSENLEQRLDRLIGAGLCPPVLVAAPDCFTRVGGNQYLNSSAVGRYQDYLTDEVLPFVGERVRVSRWGVLGKSSGGYGAMVLGMRRPDVFAALADHSGDAGFELCYLADFPDALAEWQKKGGPAKWLDAFWADVNRKRKRHHRALNALAMAAHYSPNPESPELGIDFPFDLQTGEFRPDVWQRWRANDPVAMVLDHLPALRSSRLVYLDCGTQDEFSLIWGARTLAAKIRAHGVPVHYEEFEDGHMNVTYRYDVSFPLMARALS